VTGPRAAGADAARHIAMERKYARESDLRSMTEATTDTTAIAMPRTPRPMFPASDFSPVASGAVLGHRGPAGHRDRRRLGAAPCAWYDA